MSKILYNPLEKLVPHNRNIDWDSLLSAFPIVDKLRFTVQDPFFHAEGDVLTHTKMVCDQLLTFDDFWKSSREQQIVLFVAALLHDIGKLTCTIVEDDGRVTSRGHSAVGAIDARVLLWKMNVPFDIRERICGIIAHHQKPFFVFTNKADPECAVSLLSHEGVRLSELAIVAKADFLGRISVRDSLSASDIELFSMLAKEHGCLDSPRIFPDDHTKITYLRNLGQYHANTPAFKSAGSNVIVLCGLPAAGKDTWIKNHSSDLPVISFDDTIAELGLKHGKNVGTAIHLAIDRAKELLRRKHSFIWNATHLSKQMRKKTLDICYAYDATVKIVYLEQEYKTLMNRNSKRDTTLRNADIERMMLKWEIPTSSEAHSVEYVVNK